MTEYIHRRTAGSARLSSGVEFAWLRSAARLPPLPALTADCRPAPSIATPRIDPSRHAPQRQAVSPYARFWWITLSDFDPRVWATTDTGINAELPRRRNVMAYTHA